METEFEVKFLQVNIPLLRRKLKAVGAKLVKPKTLMRRQTLDFPKDSIPPGQKKWGRVRDEGNKITMTIKHIIDKTVIDGTKEVEINVEDFAVACSFLEAAGLIRTAYQENYREEWRTNKCSITIDTWPGLKPFVEIEGSNEEDVVDLTKKLGFNMGQVEYGSIDLIYNKVIGIDTDRFNSIAELTFENYDRVLLNTP